MGIWVSFTESSDESAYEKALNQIEDKFEKNESASSGSL